METERRKVASICRDPNKKHQKASGVVGFEAGDQGPPFRSGQNFFAGVEFAGRQRSLSGADIHRPVLPRDEYADVRHKSIIKLGELSEYLDLG